MRVQRGTATWRRVDHALWPGRDVLAQQPDGAWDLPAARGYTWRRSLSRMKVLGWIHSTQKDRPCDGGRHDRRVGIQPNHPTTKVSHDLNFRRGPLPSHFSSQCALLNGQLCLRLVWEQVDCVTRSFRAIRRTAASDVSSRPMPSCPANKHKWLKQSARQDHRIAVLDVTGHVQTTPLTGSLRVKLACSVSVWLVLSLGVNVNVNVNVNNLLAISI